MMKLFTLMFCLILADQSLHAEASFRKPDELFRVLNDNDKWVVIAEKEDITLSTKSIDGMNLVAFMAKQKTSIPTEIIRDIIMDVKSYGQYFKSSGSFTFKEIERESNWVKGYHLLPIDLPFMKDREYFFRVHAKRYDLHDKTSIVHWYLIKNEPSDEQMVQNISKDAIKLDYGAGMWMAEPIDEKEYILSYRLYLDPGGSIPGFAVELLNKMNIVNVFKDVVKEATHRNITAVP